MKGMILSRQYIYCGYLKSPALKTYLIFLVKLKPFIVLNGSN